MCQRLSSFGARRAEKSGLSLCRSGRRCRLWHGINFPYIKPRAGVSRKGHCSSGFVEHDIVTQFLFHSVTGSWFTETVSKYFPRRVRPVYEDTFVLGEEESIRSMARPRLSGGGNDFLETMGQGNSLPF